MHPWVRLYLEAGYICGSPGGVTHALVLALRAMYGGGYKNLLLHEAIGLVRHKCMHPAECGVNVRVCACVCVRVCGTRRGVGSRERYAVAWCEKVSVSVCVQLGSFRCEKACSYITLRTP